MRPSLDKLQIVRAMGNNPSVSSADRIGSVRDGVALMRGLASKSSAGFRERLLRLARDTESHAVVLESARTKVCAQ